MKLTFKEEAAFARVRDELLGGEEGYRALQNILMNDPRIGVVIPDTNGVRKLRVRQAGQTKGKSGGLRVIYLYLEEYDLVVFYSAYAKSVAEDLTPLQRRTIAEAVRQEKERLKR